MISTGSNDSRDLLHDRAYILFVATGMGASVKRAGGLRIEVRI